MPANLCLLRGSIRIGWRHHCRWQSVVLARVIKAVLLRSIEQGGTTLKDFLQSDGKPGYFAQELQVYGRKRRAVSGVRYADCGD